MLAPIVAGHAQVANFVTERGLPSWCGGGLRVLIAIELQTADLVPKPRGFSKNLLR